MSLILPGDPRFDETLAMPPTFWRHHAEKVGGQVAFVADAGSGLLRPASGQELEEYLFGGEYDDRIDDGQEWD